MYTKWTVSGKVACYLIVFSLFTFYLCVTGKKGDAMSRTKRHISSELPRIVTKDGHLLFMTGVNHNITFRSSAGGFVNVDGKNIKDYFGKIPDNLKQRLTLVETLLNSLSTSMMPRVNNSEKQLQRFHSQLDTLSDKVQHDLSSKVVQLTQENQQLKSRIEELEQRGTSESDTTITSILTRLTTIEGLHRNLDTTTTTSINNMKQKITSLESRPTPLSSSSRRRIFSQLRTLNRRVQTLTSALRRNECQSNPCKNGGSCYDRFNGFHCNCPTGWTGEICADDVNECAEYSGTDLGCQNGGICSNTPGSYSCTCTADWHGLHCNTRHDDCTGASNAEICGHGTCINQPRNQPGQPKFTCICDAGWTHPTNSVTCSGDVDECQSATSCFQHPSVHCINYPGSFQCSPCPPGYSGNGFTCNDVNECEINNGGCSLNPLVTCTNAVGSRNCGPCPSGYTGDGITCHYVGVCRINNGGCSSLATCASNPYVLGGRTCSCLNGYVGTGIDPGGCRRLNPSENPCQNNPCQHGGTCQVSTVGNYTCLCHSNFTGSLCEARVDYCASNPCQNGGTCLLTSVSYDCECTSSFSGTRCETQREDCGGRFYDNSGMISYPLEPGVDYPHGIDCEWVIKVFSSKVVQLNFTNLRTECHYDWLDVIDSDQRYGSRIGRYCNLNAIPNNGIINSTGRGIRLWFHSDSSIAFEGFNVSWTSQEPQCGYDIRGLHHGLLTSPRYPDNYPKHRTCEWTISMDPGQRISIMFNTFQLRANQDCNYVYLEIRNGLTPDSPLVGKFCRRVLPPPMVSSGPYLYFKFHSDGSRTDKGFNMIFTTHEGQQGCGGILTAHSGSVSSPNFPNRYSSNEDCVWIIQPGHTLILTFNNIDLPGEPPCTTDYVEIRDGSTPTSPLIGRYCGQITPPEFISNKNSIWLNFKSGQASSYVGFSMRWKIACGGVFTNPTGILESPFYGTGRDNSSDELCIFLIRQPSTKKISVLFNEFGESESKKDLTNCTSNYVEIRHGDTKSSPLLGKYCGSENLPQSSVAKGVMRLEYKGGPNSLGFSANYSTNDLYCGGVISGNVGVIMSPNVSRTNNYLNCNWNIIVDPGKLIRLSFTNFHLKSICIYNYVEIRNEGTSEGQRYCGHQNPPVFTSMSNRLQLRYMSSNRFYGVRGYFQAVFHAVNQTNVCGGNIQSPTGVVTSPNFPANYPRSISCGWSITAPLGQQVQLNITDFALETSYNCVYDSLTVRNGGYPSSPQMGRYCGIKQPFVLISHSNQIMILFNSDHSIQMKGFTLSFSSVITGCGEDIVSSSGSIISPNYPNGYRSTECSWNIHVSAGNRISIVFTDFYLGTTCSLSHLEVRDPDRNGRQIGRYCGHKTPRPFISSTNGLFLLANMQSLYLSNYFRINYHTVCENIHLNEINGIIESPGFPGQYLPMENCSWIISGLYNNSITIDCSHFELTTHTTCAFDYLEVRDGDKMTSPLVGKYCGDQRPPSFTSTGSKLRINFKTDDYVMRSGFRIEYRQNACIRYIDYRNTPRWDYNRLRYPGNNKGSGDFCVWVIRVQPGTRVKLTVSILKLDGSDSCNDEFLKISDGDTLKAPILTTLCHTPRQSAITTSTTNKMTVLFKIKKSHKERRLEATFQDVRGGCGGIYKLVDGSIQSPNYPYDYPHNSDCSWRIVPERSHFIVLKFLDFQMGGSSNCTDNYLQISQNNEIREVFCNGNSLTGRNFTFDSSVLLYFKTDNKHADRGFKVNYTQECGNFYSASIGGIISSTYMQVSTSCRWILMANQSNERITFHFSKFSSSSNCQEESVKIYNGFDELAPIIDTYCGRRIPPQITSSGSGLYIVATKKKKLIFHATYSTSVSSCGGEIFAGTGSISTPRYPNNYPVNIECVWKFKISPGNKIHLSFSDFSLENYDFCNKDYIEARNNNIRGSLIGRFCNEKPQNITAHGDLWLKFRSDEDNTRSGFIANYIQIFGGSITGTSGEIIVPDWDSPDNPTVWTITVEDDLLVFISITHVLFFKFQEECVGYLEIRDGLTSDSPLIGQYCKDEKVSLYSSSNRIYLKYVPFRNYRQEFSLSWRAVDNITAMSLDNQGNRETVFYVNLCRLLLDNPVVGYSHLVLFSAGDRLVVFG